MRPSRILALLECEFLASREGAALLPRMERGEAGIVAGIDTSGSIPREHLEHFTEEGDALKVRIRSNIALALCDVALVQGMPSRFGHSDATAPVAEHQKHRARIGFYSPDNLSRCIPTR